MTKLTCFVGMVASTILALSLASVVADGGSDGGERRKMNTPADPSLAYDGSVLIQLRVADLDRAITFYRDVLNFDLVLRNDELKWAKMKPGIPGVAIGLGVGPEVNGSGTMSMNFGVENIDAAGHLLENRGVKFLRPTITIPQVVRLADFNDPDGNKIRLAEAPTAKSERS